MIKNIRLFAGVTLLTEAFSSCYKNEFGVELTLLCWKIILESWRENMCTIILVPCIMRPILHV